jgi:hypothetical protein
MMTATTKATINTVTDSHQGRLDLDLRYLGFFHGNRQAIQHQTGGLAGFNQVAKAVEASGYFLETPR